MTNYARLQHLCAFYIFIGNVIRSFMFFLVELGQLGQQLLCVLTKCINELQILYNMCCLYYNIKQTALWERVSVSLSIIVGAINWGLIGFLNFDLVAFIFNGQQSILSRIIYALVGLSGLYALTILFTGIESIDESNHNHDYATEFSSEFENHSNKLNTQSDKERD